jgi:transcriptional regulator with XRE-family HTH domain
MNLHQISLTRYRLLGYLPDLPMKPKPKPKADSGESVPKEENFAARLRLLRFLLGRDNKSITGDAFAALLGVPPGTIRAIEAGIRKLSQADEDKIFELLGAQWDETRATWICATDLATTYSRDFYELYADARAKGYAQLQFDEDALVQALNALLENFPSNQYRQVVLRIHTFLLQMATVPGVPKETAEFIKSLRPVRIPYVPEKSKPRGKERR